MLHWGAGASFVIACSSPFCILGDGYEGCPWAIPMRMEAEAIRIRLRFARTLGIKQIKICSDSLSIIQTLQVDGLGPPQIQEVVVEIQQWRQGRQSMKFYKVPRELVRAPIILARCARDEYMKYDHLGTGSVAVKVQEARASAHGLADNRQATASMQGVASADGTDKVKDGVLGANEGRLFRAEGGASGPSRDHGPYADHRGAQVAVTDPSVEYNTQLFRCTRGGGKSKDVTESSILGEGPLYLVRLAGVTEILTRTQAGARGCHMVESGEGCLVLPTKRAGEMGMEVLVSLDCDRFGAELKETFAGAVAFPQWAQAHLQSGGIPQGRSKRRR
ncbi:hypothetical protein QJS10_CPB11g01004 [Acorus calamus]|uniref:RNase H type-1 domain-containing protein n=1 Tax=Acorus calamus TaxID=4465 RepID=A0AAV9DWE4_ACOCL|nr:hypothetical protein QJS10_CPB11g01004 [Acorus calamus]